MTIEIAQQLLDIEEKWLQPFAVDDPMNAGVSLTGFLSTKSDHRYGALAITHVNDEPAPQAIHATPKLHYPFGRDGRFHFPPIKSLAIYEKLDGTNICAYRYNDAAGEFRTTYKLRLYPVLRNSKWGPFLDMWRELLECHPAIAEVATANQCSVSFELFGARNAHLVVYEKPLACALLFGVTEEGRPVPPNRLDCLELPQARLWGELKAGQDPVAEYGRIRERMEAEIRELEDGKLSGVEGTVWYVTDPAGKVYLFKCKPESVEAVHWAAGINKTAVTATCWNLLESSDRLDYQALLPLLREEYTDEEITAFSQHIENCIAEVNAALVFRERVLSWYEKIAISVHEDKGGCMRALAAHFDRKEMKRVYTVLIRSI